MNVFTFCMRRELSGMFRQPTANLDEINLKFEKKNFLKNAKKKSK